MAVTLRFRPVVIGSAENPAAVLFITDGPDGYAVFREFEFTLPLAVRLDAVTVKDLPEAYRIGGVAVLPLREVQGDTGADAFRRLQEALRECSPGHDAKGVA